MGLGGQHWLLFIASRIFLLDTALVVLNNSHKELWEVRASYGELRAVSSVSGNASPSVGVTMDSVGNLLSHTEPRQKL